MAILREMVEKRRQKYMAFLTEVGAIVARKESANFTLSEIEEEYRKWQAARKNHES